MNQQLTKLILAGIFFLLTAALPALGQSSSPQDELLQQASSAIESGQFTALETALAPRISADLANVSSTDLPALIRVTSVWELARYLDRVTLSPDEKQTVQWLIRQPNLFPVLMSAISRQDTPGKLLPLLSALRADEGQTLDRYPDLTTAFLVDWDKGLDPFLQAPPAPTPQHVIRLLHYFQNSGARLRFSPTDLPWQLSIYMVDIKLSEADMLWAIDHYGNRSEIGDIYFDVPYDTSAYLEGGKKQIESHPYTLANILQYGGVCVDQAYFATQIAKVLGIPSAICTGQGGSGDVGHAWFGFLDILQGRHAQWDFSQGRYKEFEFWSADIDDPQTHQKLTDADVGLLAELQYVKPEARIASALLAKAADALPPAERAKVLEKAIDLSPGDRPAWLALVDLGAHGQLSEASDQLIRGVIVRYLVRTYPDFACMMLTRIVANEPEAEQVLALDQIPQYFASRPDLCAKIRLRQGELLEHQQRLDDAMRVYGDVLTRDLNAGPIILKAMLQVDRMLRGKDDMRLAKIYNQVWRSMPVPQPSAYAYTTPYYRVGEVFASLLDQLGAVRDSAAVRQRLSHLMTVAAPQQ